MSFSQFSCLPPEIRDIIWHLSFPQHSSGIYFYGELREESQSLEDHFDGGPRTPMIEGPFLVALCVSREARNAALEWYRFHGFSKTTTDTTTSPSPSASTTTISTTVTSKHHGQRHTSRGRLRPWDGATDALYISLDLWHSFSALSWSADRLVQRMGASITHLVLPARMAQSMGHTVQLRHFMPNLRTLSVVWGALPSVARCDWRPGPAAAWPMREAARGEREEMALTRLGREPRWEIAPFSVEEGVGELVEEREGLEEQVRKGDYGNKSGSIQDIAEFLCLLNQRTWTVEWSQAKVQDTLDEIDRHWNRILQVTDLGDDVESIGIMDLPRVDIVPVKLVMASQWG